ncbi:MAG TPA: Yip1 family protein [Anaerolineae bacterium]|nr:Yip1 family protein [Anaerolineae bacterium]
MTEQAATRVQLPSSRRIRAEALRYTALWLGGMFLKPEAYVYQRDRKNPFAHGFLYIALIGVIVALAAILGAGVRYYTDPSLEAIKNTVLVHLQAMPFYAQADPTFQQTFDQQYEQNWNQFGSFYATDPTNPANFVRLIGMLITTPLGWVIVWLIYGALIHLIARGWNPETSYGELLAPLALATSPQLLRIIQVFPDAGVSGLVIVLWSLICNIFAVRVAYKTTTARAVWGAFFPMLLLLVLIIVLIVIAVLLLTGRRG